MQPKETELFDVNKIREDFPILKTLVRGNQLSYFDNAATTQKPQSVIDAITNYYSTENSNIHRGVHYLSEMATQKYENSRLKIKDYINALSACELVFTRGATESINLVAATYGRKNVKEGDEILISTMEHHSNIVPWQLLCQETGAKLKIIPITDSGEIIYEEFEKLLTEKTKIVSVVRTSNTLGTINPIEEIVKTAHNAGACVLVDCAQAMPHEKVDVQKLGCDFMVFSGHKIFGPTGIGVLYGKAELLEEMPPYQSGGDMIRSVTFEKTTFNDIPNKFEAGTPHIEGAIGLGAAIDYLRGIDFKGAIEHEQNLLAYATEKLNSIEGVKIIGNAKRKAAVVSFVMDNIHPHDIGTILDDDGIAIRTGHHCTQPLMLRYGVPATARASFAFYNTIEEIDRLAKSVEKVKKVLL
jgi:cysteine desulfurase/selenocysteine lyase